MNSCPILQKTRYFCKLKQLKQYPIVYAIICAVELRLKRPQWARVPQQADFFMFSETFDRHFLSRKEEFSL